MHLQSAILSAIALAAPLVSAANLRDSAAPTPAPVISADAVSASYPSGSCIGICPSGNYLNSCINCDTSANGVLTCSCRVLSSSTARQVSSLSNSFACEYNIQNTAGYLTCQFPQGSYGSSCYACGIIEGNFFKCNCLNNNEDYVSTVLGSVSSCAYVQNVNGVLKCIGTGAPSTYKPTYQPTSEPTSSQKCVWSQYVIGNGGNEATPTQTCASKTTFNGCESNNFCCWDSSTSVCVTNPNCAVECPGLSSSACSKIPNCCTWDSSQGCIRKCPFGELNTSFC